MSFLSKKIFAFIPKHYCYCMLNLLRCFDAFLDTLCCVRRITPEQIHQLESHQCHNVLFKTIFTMNNAHLLVYFISDILTESIVLHSSKASTCMQNHCNGHRGSFGFKAK